MNGVILTGGIGSGKSSVCNLLQKFAVTIIDADKTAHSLLEVHKDEIAQIFGANILTNGVIDRKKLGALVFGDKTKLKALEEFLHPKIREQMLAKFSTCRDLCVLDIPLYFEMSDKSGYEDFKVALVYTDELTQRQRVRLRDGLSEEQISQRLNSQMPNEKKRELADFVIDNSGDLAHLENEVKKFYAWLKEENVCK